MNDCQIFYYFNTTRSPCKKNVNTLLWNYFYLTINCRRILQPVARVTSLHCDSSVGTAVVGEGVDGAAVDAGSDVTVARVVVVLDVVVGACVVVVVDGVVVVFGCVVVVRCVVDVVVPV